MQSFERKSKRSTYNKHKSIRHRNTRRDTTRPFFFYLKSACVGYARENRLQLLKGFRESTRDDDDQNKAKKDEDRDGGDDGNGDSRRLARDASAVASEHAARPRFLADTLRAQPACSAFGAEFAGGGDPRHARLVNIVGTIPIWIALALFCLARVAGNGLCKGII